MIKRTLFTTLSAFIFCCCSFAQAEEVIYQTFNIPDSTTDLSLSIVGELDIKEWSSNQVMVQTEVLLEGATPNVLKFFVKEGRYDVGMDTIAVDRSYALKSKDSKRRNIKYKGFECFEQVKTSIFIPSSFTPTADSLSWRRNHE